MPAPDNRIRLPGPKINFVADVGEVGQDHDSYPTPGQARYDHLRMYLIGLLAQQSSTDQPSQYREGTPWFDQSTTPPCLKICINGEFVPYAEAIKLGTGASAVTLSDWFSSVEAALVSISPDMSFSGTATGFAAAITIPSALRPSLTSQSRAFLYVNGLLVDPRSTTINDGVITLSLNGLKRGDKYNVIIRGIPINYFHIPDVPAP